MSLLRIAVAIALVAPLACTPAPPVAPTVVPVAPRATSPAPDPPRDDQEPPPKPAGSADEGDFTCSMHPQVHRHEAGSCPICGMDLIVTRDPASEP
jgi:Heavy metal binding domain